MKIGFIGIGLMGGPLARNLIGPLVPPAPSLRPIIPDNARHLRITAAAGTSVSYTHLDVYKRQ